MQPIVHVCDLNGLSNYKAKRVCDHTPKCKEYVVITTLNDSLTLCEKDAVAYSQTIFNELHVLPEVPVRGWADWEIKELVRILSTHEKIGYGMTKKLAEQLGKTPKQVKDKIYYLRRIGATL